MAKEERKVFAEEVVTNLMKEFNPPSAEEISKMEDELINNIIADIFADKASTVVRSQKDIDKLPEDYRGDIIVKFGSKENPAIFKNLDHASIFLEDCVAEVHGSAHVFATYNVAVTIYDNVVIDSRGDAYITAHDNACIKAASAARIDAYDSVDIDMYLCNENAFVEVFAHDDCTVEINGYRNCVDLIADKTVAVFEAKEPQPKTLSLGSELIEDEAAFNAKYAEEKPDLNINENAPKITDPNLIL